MKVDIKDTGTLGKVITFTIPKHKVDIETNKFLDDVRKRAEVPGFRKGQATDQALFYRLGNLIKGEVSSKLIFEAIDDFVKDSKIKVTGSPSVILEDRAINGKTYAGTFKIDGSFVCSLDIETEPTLTAKDYIGVNISEPMPNLDAWLKIKIEDFQYVFASRTQITDRKTKLGDEIVVDMKYLGSPTGTSSDIEMQTVVLGTGQNDEYLLIDKPLKEEFQLTIGKSVTDGEDLICKIFIHSIAEVVLPSIDDSLAQLSGYSDLITMKADLLAKGVKEELTPIRIKIAGEAIAQIIDSNPFELPKSWTEMEARLTAQRLGFKEFPTDIKIITALEDIGSRVVRQNFILDKIYEKEETIHLSADELSDLLIEEGKKHGKTLEQIIALLKNNSQYEGFVVMQEHNRTIDFILSNAKVKEKE